MMRFRKSPCLGQVTTLRIRTPTAIRRRDLWKRRATAALVFRRSGGFVAQVTAEVLGEAQSCCTCTRPDAWVTGGLVSNESRSHSTWSRVGDPAWGQAPTDDLSWRLCSGRERGGKGREGA
jgi:hypothetical protein